MSQRYPQTHPDTQEGAQLTLSLCGRIGLGDTQDAVDAYCQSTLFALGQDTVAAVKRARVIDVRLAHTD